ncbi:restriction endonuclease subunit S [Aeromonas salmonicida]|uniref:restriction endonuclease subunit S n=1 Tax=Aeromonas salmonicida TaxID=645 RepID=UPI00259D5E0E|nr:restriction endonuclease subunit S [Aeromonas salmonicida]MDM5064332.1 restriction endonuclease subunit S [Aeromonas salmonicida]
MSEAVTTRQQELAGKYRPYPEYKDSGVVWLGEMPSTWVLAKTARYFKIAMGQTILKEQLEDDGEWPVYSATEGDHYFGRVNNPQVRLGCGDLVIPARGNSIGFVKLVKEQVTTTQTTIYCKHLTQKIYPEYAYYFMVGQKKNLFWFTQTAIPQITVEEIGSNPILLLSFEEQRTIAAFLDYETARIDRLITQQQRLIELLKEKRQAVISHTVIKGLNPNAVMKKSGIEWFGQVPEHWDASQLKYIVKLGTSITYGIVQAGPHIEDGIPYIKTSDMSGTKLPLDGYSKTSPEIDASYSRSKVYSGDLVIAIRATVGKCHIVPDAINGANLTQGTAKISPSEKITSEFLHLLIMSSPVQLYFDANAKGATFREITLEMLRRTPIVIPPLSEQKLICEYINKTVSIYDRLISKCEFKISLLVERRAALISAAVTGKIDLRGWTPSAEEAAA